MKGLLLTILALTLVLMTFAQSEASDDSTHELHRRSIFFKPQVTPPPCVFYECIRSCRAKGYKGGGWCSPSGCACYN